MTHTHCTRSFHVYVLFVLPCGLQVALVKVVGRVGRIGRGIGDRVGVGGGSGGGGVGGRENTQAYALVGPSSSSNVLGGMEDEDVDVDGDV